MPQLTVTSLRAGTTPAVVITDGRVLQNIASFNGALTVNTPSSGSLFVEAFGGSSVALRASAALKLRGDVRFHNAADAETARMHDRLLIGTTANGETTAGGMRLSGRFQIHSDGIHGALPTTNPGIAGRWWNDGGTVKISTG